MKKHRFLRSAGILLAMCLISELALRLFGYGNYTIYRPDERLLWVPAPGRSLSVVNHLAITTNHQGFRYPVDLKPKQADEFRIIAFGDSATQGWGVDDSSHFSALLEKMLNQQPQCSGKHFEAISAGVNAYPNSLVAEDLKEVLENNVVQPDVAIVAYSGNSNFEKLTKLQGQEREKFLRRVELKAIVRRSAIYNFLVEDVLRTFAYYKLRHLIMADALSNLDGMDNLDMNQFNDGLKQSLMLCRSKHVQLVFLLLGEKDQGPNSEMHPFQKAMLEFAEKEHVPIVNMIAAIDIKDRQQMFLDPDHFTVAGHQVAARQLFEVIRGLPNYEIACSRMERRENLTSSSQAPSSRAPIAHGGAVARQNDAGESALQ